MLIKSMVLERLISLGCNGGSDLLAIDFCIQKVENHIKSYCNIAYIPDELIEIVVDRVCGEFLFSKKQIGQLDNTFNFEAAVKSVQAGDTNVSFDTTQSPENRFDALLNYLQSRGEGDLICYRKIKW